MLKLTELIDKYLMGELNAQEMKEFEERLKTDTKLQKEVDLQTTLMKGIELASIHRQVSSAKNSYFIKSIFLKVVVTLLIAGGIGALTYLAIHKKANSPTQTSDTFKTQQFFISNNTDTLLETQNGMVFIIPAHSFETQSDSVEIKIEEALDAASIMMKGLSTVSDSLLLETAGMFKFDASVKGNKVNILKEITASLPTDKVDKDMMLFKGVEDNKGNINWVNPQKITSQLKTYNIEKLNFFPKGYLDIIDALYKVKGINEESRRIYFEMSGYHANEISDAMKIPEEEIAGVFSNGKYYIANPARKGFDSTGYIEILDFEIDPSRIQAFWNKNFNSSLLATKEFEERMQFIFTTCNPDFINYYINNLNQPMYIIDSLCANIASGDQHNKFLEFYRRKDGGVNTNNKAITELNAYYNKKYETYKSAAAQTWKDYYAKNNEADKRFSDKFTRKANEESIRNSDLFTEELCKNLTNAYNQIGIAHDCNKSIIPKQQAYIFTIASNGWYNLDKYVTDATLQRKTLDYTDPLSGKKAIIEYAECNIQIKDINIYDMTNVYLLPSELSSYQKLKLETGLYSENLNMSFSNAIAIIAKKGNEWYWYSIPVAQGKTYTIELTPIKESQLKKELNLFNKSKKKDIIDDLDYQEYAETYQQDLKKRALLEQERRKIARIIFPCSYPPKNAMAPPPANPVPSH